MRELAVWSNLFSSFHTLKSMSKEDRELKKVIEAKKFLEARGYTVKVKPPKEWKPMSPFSWENEKTYEY